MTAVQPENNLLKIKIFTKMLELYNEKSIYDKVNVSHLNCDELQE